LLAVVLTAAVETDAALCRTVAAIQNAAGGPQPLLGLPAAALASPQPPVETFFALPQGRAVRSCLLRLDNVDSALPERSLAIYLPTLAALTGHAADWGGGA
jgi:hypothetical protein